MVSRCENGIQRRYFKSKAALLALTSMDQCRFYIGKWTRKLTIWIFKTLNVIVVVACKCGFFNFQETVQTQGKIMHKQQPDAKVRVHKHRDTLGPKTM